MIVWVVALRAEAAPLVAARALRSSPRSTPWPLYVAADGTEALVVSGVGRSAAAAASGWAHGHLAAPASACWLNVGIAGHSTGPVGRALLAHKVVEAATGRAWYPPPIPGVELPSDVFFTVDRAESEFACDGGYEMEAAGFLAAVGRWGSVELAHVVKVVSDTRAASPEALEANDVSALVGDRLDEIDFVATRLVAWSVELVGREEEPPGFGAFTDRWRFSVTQRRELERLLRRHEALAGRVEPPLPEARDGRAALAELARVVRRLAVGA